jgi:HPr kinase/phosphorylase
VLILGPAGIGKSELALDLISRGHALVADDSPVFTQQADGRWLGHCPFPLQDFLEVRGLGILNVRRLFGEQAVCAEHPLDLIIRLEERPSSPEDRLAGAWRDYRLGDATLPELPLPVRRGRNLALLVETAARLQACGAGDGIGYNAAHELSRRLGKHFGKEPL